MTVYKCDRCGAIVEDGKFIYGLRAGKLEHRYCEAEIVLTLDMCPACYESLIDWAEMKKE